MRRMAVLVLCLGTFCTGCRPDVLVEIVSRVYADGSIDRQVAVTGREKPMTEPPETPGWLQDKAGLVLAEPGAWDRVSTSPSGFHAEGIFRSAGDVPPVLAHLQGASGMADRNQVQLAEDDLVVLTRWRFRESLGDPFGPAHVDSALNAILERVADYFRDELSAMYGDRIDLDGVDRFITSEAGTLAREFLLARQAAPGMERLADRYDRWRTILVRHNAPVVYPEEPQAGELPPDFWELQIDPLLDWSRERLAASVSTADEAVEARHLDFIPPGERLEEHLTELVIRLYGSEEAALSDLEPLLQALEGHYASNGSSRYRFRCRITLPGTVLGTNGVVEDGQPSWFFRGEALAGDGMTLLAESAELNLPALKALGARRDYDALELLNLVDILADRDPDDRLLQRLRDAVEAGNLAKLHDENEELPPDLQPLALELQEILSRN